MSKSKKEKLSPVVSIPIDGKTGMLFAQLIESGLASLKLDKKLKEGIVQASIDSKKGKPNLVLSMQSAYYVPASNAEKK